MSKGIFVTGTGTDVGKTFVTALIIKKLREQGLNAGYYKAALSGAEKRDGNLTAGDAEYVCNISGLSNEPNSMVTYIYETAVSPHLAAKIEGTPIEISKICSDFKRIKSEFEYVTIEGSGGIVCPLRVEENTIMLTDVIKEFDLDVILVAQASLGTINSTVLTVEYAKQQNIHIRGIILNGYEENCFLHRDNKKQIEYFTGIPVIVCVSPNAEDLDIEVDTLIGLYKEV